MIAHDKFIQKYDYNPETGEFIWVKSKESELNGKPAGYYNPHLNRWYVSTGDSKQIPRSRAIWYWMTGVLPEGYEVVHINADSADDRWSNLKLVTISEKRRMSPRNKRPYKGVTKYGRDQWKARIHVNGSFKTIGVFDTPELAADMYRRFVELTEFVKGKVNITAQQVDEHIAMLEKILPSPGAN
ncbi:HNH endonuclease [Pseudaminobacter sp. 19-2017]|uniref:HNH endonuclease n=1 Tax=Pseudaminobacter soli (ex Zhang et al. 2022) TaxID=2831468 RepID=A0A942E2U0_9HYPH|nr:HNH endonuclease [Pseudaminobacter soli]MBS3650020.1 HNH endonuclease [Pseudaminobacter soli]